MFEAVKVDDVEMRRLADELALEVLDPELGTRPRVYYKNLFLINRCFVSGSVTMTIEGVEECANGATVVLRHNAIEVRSVTTDMFGEFKIDRLMPQTTGYQLEVHLGTSKAIPISFEVRDESLYLGQFNLLGDAVNTVGEKEARL